MNMTLRRLASQKSKLGPSLRLLSVDPAEVAVPANGDDVGEQDPVLQRQVGEVDELHKRPDHPVGPQRRPPVLLEPLLGAGALHGGHAAQEDADHDRGEGALVAADAGEGLEARAAGDDDLARKQVEPGRGDGAEDEAAVERHAAGALEVVRLEAALLDELLGRDVARGEEDRRRHGLREQRAGSQSAVVPGHCQARLYQAVRWRENSPAEESRHGGCLSGSDRRWCELKKMQL